MTLFAVEIHGLSLVCSNSATGQGGFVLLSQGLKNLSPAVRYTVCALAVVVAFAGVARIYQGVRHPSLVASAAAKPTKTNCNKESTSNTITFDCTIVEPQGFTFYSAGIGTADAVWKLTCPASKKPLGDKGNDLGIWFTIKVNTVKTPEVGDIMVRSPICKLGVDVTSIGKRGVTLHIYDRFGSHMVWSAKTA